MKRFEINILNGNTHTYFIVLLSAPCLSAGLLLGAEMGEAWVFRGRSGGRLGLSSSDLQANVR